MKNIIKIVEQNVDGCGGSAEMFASCSEPITSEILNELEGLLAAVKKEVISEDWDTEAMVNEAVRRFNAEHTWEKSGILLHNPQLQVISLISAEVEF